MATYLTKAGVAQLEKALTELKVKKRRLSEEIEKARQLGDLRENAEYHAAKERLQQVLARIDEIQLKLANVHVIDSSQLPTGVATLGTQISVKDLGTQTVESYILVGPDESDPSSGKISVQSPLGKAFLGRKAKEKVSVQLPGGSFTYQILSIQPAA